MGAGNIDFTDGIQASDLKAIFGGKSALSIFMASIFCSKQKALKPGKLQASGYFFPD